MGDKRSLAMKLPAYDNLVDFASRGNFEAELHLAKAEFIQRTGDLFESDPAFEHRMAVFLEWYMLDRKVTIASNATPAKLYIEHVTPELTTQQINRLRPLTRTMLSLFEFKKKRDDAITATDLLTNAKYSLSLPQTPPGMEIGDIVEGRVFAHDDVHYLSENLTFVPRVARKTIIKAAKRFRKEPCTDDRRINFVHKINYLANRSSRYKHVDPLKIFAEIES